MNLIPTRMHSSRMHTTLSSSHQLGGVYLSSCWDTPPPPVWAWRPPWVWAWRPPLGCGDITPGVGLETPQPDPSTSPLGVGLETPLETCKACWDITCKACWDTPSPPPTPHPCGQTGTCKNITFANVVCGR